MKHLIAATAIVLLASSTALAQWGYAPVVVAPVPTVSYYAPPAYYAPYAPAPVPMVSYYAPYAPAPVYAYPPAVVVAPRPVVIVPRVYVPGQPVRNVLRAVF
jgi:hypothetical protein